jgi:leucyl aminopeptidase
MAIKIQLTKNTAAAAHRIILCDKDSKYAAFISKEDAAAAKVAFDAKQPMYQTVSGGKSVTLVMLDKTREPYKQTEDARRAAHSVSRGLNGLKATEASFENITANKALGAAFTEGAILSSYQFLKYKTKEVKPNTLTKLLVNESSLTKAELTELEATTQGTLIARELVNEPLSYLTAEQLSKEIVKTGKEAGFKVEVLNKKKIESLKMGGLLAVNRGSQRPPTFTILEYKPSKAKNKQPLILVGKGVVYDTGGLSLKPTPNGMDMMKCDMGGAATVIGTLYAIAKLKLPIHVVGLIPATDNRPGEDAYVPGDVVPMMNGMNVEVLKTDAEGRMILADALTYAGKYKPELVFDFATLTGSAKAALSGLATAYMGTAGDDVKKKVEASSKAVHEHVWELPFWEEYGQLIKSDIADIKNIGGSDAGAITAGKFLEHFATFPWLHFDIAGSAYLLAEDSYRGRFGTGVGVRMMVDFIKNY